MKYLIMTEGTCEKALLDILLEREILKYKYTELLYEDIHQARQIKNKIIEMINQLPSNEKIEIIRIGDKLSDRLIIPASLKDRIIDVKKICIKPEFEILHILFNKHYDKYNKVKNNYKPSEFVHTFLKDYSKTYEYNYNYFNKLINEQLVNLLKEYDVKRLGTHTTEEKSLSSISC